MKAVLRRRARGWSFATPQWVRCRRCRSVGLLLWALIHIAPAGLSQVALQFRTCPVPATKLKRHIETEFELRAAVLECSSQGTALLELPAYPGENPVHLLSQLDVEEVYGQNDGQQPLELERSYLAWNARDLRVEAGSPYSLEPTLIGRRVLFRRALQEIERELLAPDAQGGRETPANADALKQLAFELDWRVLLPPTAVAVNASWEVDLRELEALLVPGYQRTILPGDPATPWLARLGQAQPKQAEPRLVCTYRGAAERAGRELALISLQLVHRSLRLSELPAWAVLVTDAAALRASQVQHDVELTLAGELAWDNARGCMHSAQLSAQLSVLRRLTATLQPEFGPAEEVSAAQQFQAVLQIRASCSE